MSKKKKNLYLKVVIGLFSLFVILVLSAPFISLTDVDPVKYELIHSMLTWIMTVNTYFYDHIWIILGVVAVIIAFACYYFKKKR